MDFHVAGTLTTSQSEQPSFKGFVVEAAFDRSRARPGAFLESHGAMGGPFSVRISAVSDESGAFELLFPERAEIVSPAVTFRVSSPDGRLRQVLEVKTPDLGDTVTIEIPASVPEASVPTAEGVVVDALFKTDAALRQAITKNLTARRGESDATAARIDKAWTYRPTKLVPQADPRRHYVAPGTDPGDALQTVATNGVTVWRTANARKGLTLRDSAGLRTLIGDSANGAGSIGGSIALQKMIDYINQRSAGSSVLSTSVFTECQADLEAEAMLNAIAGPPAIETDTDPPEPGDLPDPTPEAGEAKAFVKGAVAGQMASATSPETRLNYGSVPRLPNSADRDMVQSSLMDTFQLRPGASDVTAYHDFHTLQIAFEHVWTQLFDGQIESLGRELYREYVKLKDFSGSTQPDLSVGSYDDLRRLIEEVRKLSQVVQEDLPRDLRGESTKDDGGSPVNHTMGDLGRAGLGVVTGGLSELAILILKEVNRAGQKPVLNWSQIDSKGLPLPNGFGTIIATFTNDAPAGTVQLRLATGVSHLKIMEYQPWSDSKGKFLNQQNGNRASHLVSNAGYSNGYTSAWITVPANAVGSGVVEFASEHSPGLNLGRYVLAGLEEKLPGGWQVTFTWTD